MSYILEALKKSEQERRRGEMPEISRFETSESQGSHTLKLWPIVVVVLVVVNAAVVFIWAPWSPEEALTTQPAQSDFAQSKLAKPAVQPQAVKTGAKQKTVARKPNYIRQKVAVEPEPEIISPSVIDPEPDPYVEPVQTSYLPQLQELPSSIQSRVPDMSFSSHMYSSSARFRSIIINGRRLKEGQFLDDDIQVREITEKGVILGLDGTVFEVDVLGQWVN